VAVTSQLTGKLDKLQPGGNAAC